MKTLCSIGPMRLLEIKRILQRDHADVRLFIIHFNGGKLTVTNLHAFKLENGNNTSAAQLHQGDRIWVDAHAFLSDGSLTLNEETHEKETR